MVFADAEPSGLGAMLGGLIDQNLRREPARERLLGPMLVTIEAPDAGVGVTLRVDPGRILVADGAASGAQIAISADGPRLLELAAAPLRFGLPDPLRPDGRAVLRDVLARRVRIRGMISHPRLVSRLTMLLSVR